MTEQWESRQVRSFDGERFIGATMGLMDMGKVAYECGITPDAGNIMIYCWRRFGYPIHGWSKKTQVCTWFLSTPFDGSVISVTPSDHSPFAYLFTESFYAEVEDIIYGPHFEREKKFRAWADVWTEQNGQLPLNGYSDHRHDELWELWPGKTDDCPNYKNKNERLKLPWHSPVNTAYDAVEVTLKDLLRPVCINGRHVNINGIYLGKLSPVRIYEKAGFGLGDLEKVVGGYHAT